MIFHRKVTRCERKRNIISIIKKSPWAFGKYTDTHSDWHAARQSQPFHNSRFEQRILNPPVNPWIEALSHLRHYLWFLVELWPVRTKLSTRGTSISFPPRPLLASCFRHFYHVIEQGVVLVCRYSHNFLILIPKKSCFVHIKSPSRWVLLLVRVTTLLFER